MTELFTAKIESIVPHAEDQVFMMLDVPPEVWGSHRQPSQYIELVLEGQEPWHGTIANHTEMEHFEFLVKDKGGRSHEIAMLEPKSLIQISKPMGSGFPIHAYRKHNVILGCSGVAICAMRPVIQEIMLYRGDWGRVDLFYGERTDHHFAFIEEREWWRESRIDVHLSASRPAEGSYWKGHVGYIQDNLEAVSPEIRNTVVFLAGLDAMIEDFTDSLLRMGMRMNMIILNV